jgi:competence protein ComEA
VFDPLDLVAIEPPDRRDQVTSALTRMVGSRFEPGRLAVWAAGLVGVVVVSALVWVLVRPDTPAVEDILPMATTTAPASASTGVPGPAGPLDPTQLLDSTGAPASTTSLPSDLLVHAAGAVAAPGVYELAGGARVADLVQAAGGPSPDADLDRLNLAEPLVDGSRVYVPRVGELDPPPVLVPSGGTGAATGEGAGGAAEDVAGPVDLNRATVDELDELPGVGPATAEAILAHREANGPFASVDELLDVRGIGEAKLAALRDLVTVG